MKQQKCIQLLLESLTDCPLLDPEVVDLVIELFHKSVDYASNIDPPSFPDGLDVEVFTRSSLEIAKQ